MSAVKRPISSNAKDRNKVVAVWLLILMHYEHHTLVTIHLQWSGLYRLKAFSIVEHVGMTRSTAGNADATIDI